MPLYEYLCKDCGLRFDRRQHFSEPAISVCPECEGKVVRLIQPAGIIFKGKGFYVTDNRTKSSMALPGARKDTPDTKETKEAKETSDSSSKDEVKT